MPSKESIQKGMDSIFAPNPWYYDIRKEVRKRMAIDYKVEWEKLRKKCGRLTIIRNGITTLEDVMRAQIRDTINDREKLMEEYVRENMATDIVDGDKHFHHITITNTRTRGVKSPIGTMHIYKADFAAWCKKKERR